MKAKIDLGSMVLDFDPKSFKTKAGAAKALCKALRKLAVDMGGSEEEVFIRTPKENVEFGLSAAWHVSWEEGPYEWAIPASFEIANADAGWYTEPYYSFNLEFAS